MALKRITVGTTSGSSVYCIIKRESNGYLMNASTGSFYATAGGDAVAKPCLSLSEHTVIKGRYDVTEGRTVWPDSLYSVTAYRRAGASPVPANDTVIGIHNMYVKDDTEVLVEEDLAAVNWDKISSPVLVAQNLIGVTPVVRFNMIMDRTIDLNFDLHSDVTGDTFYFAMKNDRNNEYYDVRPIECTIDDATNGLLSLTIPETDTQNLDSSKYYGEFMRLTVSGKYQTLVLFDIDLFPAIVSSRDF